MRQRDLWQQCAFDSIGEHFDDICEDFVFGFKLYHLLWLQRFTDGDSLRHRLDLSFVVFDGLFDLLNFMD